MKLIQPRFSLFALFGLLTLAALILGGWSLWPMSRGITKQQALAVQIAMTEAEVEAVAGPPDELSTLGMSATWSYRVSAPVGTEPARLVVVFGNGRVSGIRREGGGYFAFPR